MFDQIASQEGAIGRRIQQLADGALDAARTAAHQRRRDF
jgi:hypothetical protein